MQLLYFNKEGKLVSFHNNCYAGGFPNLHWNHAHQFDHFIPETTIPLTDSALNLKMLLAHIRSIGADTQILTGEITVAVLWAGFMKRQSRGMIRVAKKNLQLDKDKTAKIIFVNTDNCYVEGDYRKRINKIN